MAAGKRTMTYPSGMKVVEQLNARDLITSILQNGNEVVTMQYNAAGQKTTQGYANGITTTYGYNENGWLSSITAVGGDLQSPTNIMSLAMTYDAIGNITQREDALNADRTETYGYDAISQLISFKRGTAVDKQYQFDLLGNRVKVLENGIATNYTSNNVNAYTAITGGINFTPQYDDNGNMLNDDKHTYTYDWNSKQVGVDNGTVTVKYDALGRRIAKNNITFYYIGDQMVEEYTDGQLTASYLYGNDIDEALQMKRGSSVYYYHTNHLGSTMALSNATGAIVERVDYDAYGLPTFYDADGNVLAQSSIGNAILFTGREYDAESGTYYYRARSMHPNVGRFMQKDPLQYIDGLGDYSYVNNSVVLWCDVFGLAKVPDRIEKGSQAMSYSLPSNLKLGTNYRIYVNPMARGNQYYRIVPGNPLGKAGFGLGVVSTGISAFDYYDRIVNSNNWEEVGGHLGEFSGQAIGGMAGVEAGAIIGAKAGAVVGAWFGGVGAAPGAIIGAIAGGIIGGLVGSSGGGKIGKWGGGKIGSHYDPKMEINCDQPQSPFPVNWPGSFEYSPGPKTPLDNSGIVYV